MVPPSRINASVREGLDEQQSADGNPENDHVPPFDRLAIPSEIKMPKWVWCNVYRLLRDAPNQRLSQHELNVEHSRRFKQSIGGKTMLTACSVKKIVELLCALPFVEPVKVNGVMKYQLRPLDSGTKILNYRDKLDLMESKSKKVKDSSSDEEDFEPEIKLDLQEEEQNSDDDFYLPRQPVELLPSWGVMPDALREKIYTLLMTRKFREGVELKQFRDAYTQFYSSSISNQRDCKMNADQMFYCLKDIIEIVKDEAGRIWIKPRTRNEIKAIHRERPVEIFSLDPVFKEVVHSKRDLYLYTKFGRPLNQKKSLRIDPKDAGCVPLSKSCLAEQLNRREIYHDSPSTSSSASNFDECPRPPVQRPAQTVISPFLITPGQNKPQTVQCETAYTKLVPADNSRSQQNLRIDREQPPESVVRFQNIVSLKAPSPDYDNSCSIDFSATGNRTGVNTKALGHYLQGIERTNQKKASKVRSENFDESNNTQCHADKNELWETPSPECLQYANNEPKDVFRKIREMLHSYKDQWIQINDIFSIYAKIEGIPLTFSFDEGHDLHEALEKRPELFSFNRYFDVKSRPLPKLPVRDVTSLSESFTDFGIATGDIYIKSFPEIQLVKDEIIQVLVSHFKENGDLYIQMTRMEQAFCDLEIDMNTFYNNPFQNETYIMKDEIMKIGMPVAVCFLKTWRRSRIVDIHGDRVSVQQIDFGSIINVRKEEMRYLKSTFVTNAVTPCAILCSLHGVRHDFENHASLTSFIQDSLSDSLRIVATVVDKRPIDGVPLINLDVYPHDSSTPINLNVEIARRYNVDPASSNGNSIPRAPLNDLNADEGRWATSAAQYIKNSNYFTETESSNVSPVDTDLNSAFREAQNPLDFSHDTQFQVQDQPSTSDVTTVIAADPAVQDILETLSRTLNDANVSESEKDTCRQILQTFLPQR